jgi:hypothetical protein
VAARLKKAGRPPWHAGHAWEGVHNADVGAPGLGLESGSGTDATRGMTGGSPCRRLRAREGGAGWRQS